MLNMFTKHSIGLAGKSGWDIGYKYGGIGAGVGAAYGIVSDQETFMSGAMKGGVLAGGAGIGMKAFGTRLVHGMNARAAGIADAKSLYGELNAGKLADELAPGLKDHAAYASTFLNGGGFSQKGGELIKTREMLKMSNSFQPTFDNIALNMRYSKGLGEGWFGGTVGLSKNAELMMNFGGHFHTALAKNLGGVNNQFAASVLGSKHFGSDTLQSIYGKTVTGFDPSDQGHIDTFNKWSEDLSSTYQSHLSKARTDVGSAGMFKKKVNNMS